jgi:hypothetical protein
VLEASDFLNDQFTMDFLSPPSPLPARVYSRGEVRTLGDCCDVEVCDLGPCEGLGVLELYFRRHSVRWERMWMFGKSFGTKQITVVPGRQSLSSPARFAVGPVGAHHGHPKSLGTLFATSSATVHFSRRGNWYRPWPLCRVADTSKLGY